MDLLDFKSTARHFGVSNAVLGTAKKNLRAGIDFLATRPQRFTAAGIAALEAHFGLTKKTAPPLTVRARNGRMILCIAPDATEWQLEVRTPELFTKGFVIGPEHYTPSDTRPNYGRQIGRNPRAKGRW